MSDLIELRRHRFDALHGFLTGTHAALPRRHRTSRRCDAVSCLTILAACAMDMVGTTFGKRHFADEFKATLAKPAPNTQGDRT
jgi:hypothetical protein